MQVDGCGSSKEGETNQVLVIGATNRPFDLDEAALRRLTKRIYIELPDAEARLGAIFKMLDSVSYKISKSDLNKLKQYTEGYSFADINANVKDAAMGPIRDIQGNPEKIMKMDKSQLRPINF